MKFFGTPGVRHFRTTCLWTTSTLPNSWERNSNLADKTGWTPLLLLVCLLSWKIYGKICCKKFKKTAICWQSHKRLDCCWHVFRTYTTKFWRTQSSSLLMMSSTTTKGTSWGCSSRRHRRILLEQVSTWEFWSNILFACCFTTNTRNAKKSWASAVKF